VSCTLSEQVHDASSDCGAPDDHLRPSFTPLSGTYTLDPSHTRIGLDGSVTISRKDHGITWNAALETGGVLVSDKIVLEFEVSAIKNA
jgi:polyisoprenoid-binding protein YceI